MEAAKKSRETQKGNSTAKDFGYREEDPCREKKRKQQKRLKKRKRNAIDEILSGGVDCGRRKGDSKSRRPKRS